MQKVRVGSQFAVLGSSSSSKGTRPPGQCASKFAGKVWLGSGATAAMGAGQNLTLPGTDIPAVAFAVRFFVPKIGSAKIDVTGTDGVSTFIKRSFSFSSLASACAAPSL